MWIKQKYSLFKNKIFTARVRSTREGNVFTGVSLSVHGGVPHSQVLSLVSGPRSFPRELPYSQLGVGGLGVYPSPSWQGHTPAQVGVGAWSQPGGTPPPPTEERVLATWRAVCLLRLRRENLLFNINLLLNC